jgi:hypothetical protein
VLEETLQVKATLKEEKSIAKEITEEAMVDLETAIEVMTEVVVEDKKK